MTIDGGMALMCSLSLSPKYFETPHVFFTAFHQVTLAFVDYSTFLSDVIPVLWGNQEVHDGVVSFEMDLDSRFTSSNLKSIC